MTEEIKVKASIVVILFYGFLLLAGFITGMIICGRFLKCS